MPIWKVARVRRLGFSNSSARVLPSSARRNFFGCAFTCAASFSRCVICAAVSSCSESRSQPERLFLGADAAFFLRVRGAVLERRMVVALA